MSLLSHNKCYKNFSISHSNENDHFLTEKNKWTRFWMNLTSNLASSLLCLPVSRVFCKRHGRAGEGPTSGRALCWWVRAGLLWLLCCPGFQDLKACQGAWPGNPCFIPSFLNVQTSWGDHMAMESSFRVGKLEFCLEHSLWYVSLKPVSTGSWRGGP